MEKRYGLTSEELEKVFAQIKAGNTSMDKKVYEAYLPLINKCTKQFGLRKERVYSIYDDIFSYLYNNILNGTLNSVEFGSYFEKLIIKQCIKAQQVKEDLTSQHLPMSSAKKVPSREKETRENQEFATVSLMFVIQVLNELQSNPEMAAEHGLTEEKIKIIKDYLGFNKQHKRYNVDEIAEKYQITHGRATAVVARTLKTLRDMDEFQPIKDRLSR